MQLLMLIEYGIWQSLFKLENPSATFQGIHTTIQHNQRVVGIQVGGTADEMDRSCMIREQRK